VVKASD